MIDNLFSLVFRCRHRRLTRPVTPIGASGEPEGQTYVVCLECAKHFAYDAREMKMGKALPAPPPSGHVPVASKAKISRKLWITIPAGLALGALLKFKNKKDTPR
jgi:hypothetical protein